MDYTGLALFSDLDGTLLNSQRQVSLENRRALEQFTAGGGLFGVSTGRAPMNALHLLPKVPINTWSVVLNGAEAYHFGTGAVAFPRLLPKLRVRFGAMMSACAAVAFPRLLPKLRTAALIQWVLEHLPQVNILLCSERRLFFLSPPHLADPDFLASHQPCIFSGLEVPWREPWLKILFAAPRPLLERLEQQAEESGVSEGTERVYTCPTYLEFLPQGVHKGRCLGDLRCLDVFRQRRMIAIGDYSNDVELLQEADIAVAVDNALPEVKAVADYCTVSHNDSAIAHLIANILPRI